LKSLLLSLAGPEPWRLVRSPLPLTEEDRASLGNIGWLKFTFPRRQGSKPMPWEKPLNRQGISGGICFYPVGDAGRFLPWCGLRGRSNRFSRRRFNRRTIGAISGAFAAIPPQDAARIEASAKRTIEEFKVQELLRDTFLSGRSEKTPKHDPLDNFWAAGTGRKSSITDPCKKKGFQTSWRFRLRKSVLKPLHEDPRSPSSKTPFVSFLENPDPAGAAGRWENPLYARFELTRGPRKQVEWEAENSRVFFEELEALSRLLPGR